MQPGDRMTWLHQTRGGYRYIIPVDAEVVRTTARRVLVRVRLRNGDPVERWV